MFDFIPLPYYTPIFYHVLFAVMIIIAFFSAVFYADDKEVKVFSQYFGLFFGVMLVLYMGLRPVSGRYFGDMSTYAKYFSLVQRGQLLTIKHDYLFNYFMMFCAKFMSVNIFFLLVAALYTIPCWLFSRKYFGSYWFFGFFMFIGSFSFWAYGTNGIRNGLATAIFLLACVSYQRISWRYVLLVLAVGMHSAMMIPVAAFITASLIRNPKYYLWLWLACIPVSLVAGNALQGIFAGLVSDSRATDYLTKGNLNNDTFSSTGFRWDFLFYSGFAVFAGWYYIFKKNIQDRFYIHLWGTYMIANAFWVLVIKANFSNRFAYLSWFLMAAVIGYPLFRYKLWPDQMKYIGWIACAYYMFTYLMFLKS